MISYKKKKGNITNSITMLKEQTNVYPATNISNDRLTTINSDIVTSGHKAQIDTKTPMYPHYVERQNRQESFSTPSWSVDNKPDPILFADCGFFFTGNQDLVRCHQCGIGLKDWVREDDVLTEHVKHSSTCDFIVMKFGKNRIDRMKLALTSGNVDLCRCFTCDGGLKDWSSGDDPIKEHATNFPNCSYIIRLKGSEYIKCQQQSRQSYKPMGTSGGSSALTQPTLILPYHPMNNLPITDSDCNQDLVRCHQCGIGMKDWVREDDVLTEHVKHSSTCDFIVMKFGKMRIDRMKLALTSV
ncbi:baculoviral IAP repeat-containing protein 7-A-like isoform X2 [Mercenaria mercenaria]|uniref:baculoviral IAP repeat-containing protein 7-A-like isoform X2 n=1 Tax=Mercenaria mercenaria TaxID=6596 RepID=UPI00234F3AE1|nr:baculoviral IAP repeat-containing protein 7-A-like isoform X2 [Mercenaria mercenaria]